VVVTASSFEFASGLWSRAVLACRSAPDYGSRMPRWRRGIREMGGEDLWCSVLDGAGCFDASVFGIRESEAAQMDPQQRLVLGASRALVAGWSVDQRSSAGVFAGVMGVDYGQKLREGDVSAYTGTGLSGAAVAGRVSYTYGMQGPCMAVDTACSSALVACETAWRMIASGKLDRALAGGVQTWTWSESFAAVTKARMVCADGRCKTFDARANGYSRGEGCGMVALEHLPTSTSLSESSVIGVFLSAGVNQDGRSSTLTAPNGPAQQRLMVDACREAGLGAGAVRYVECHGTGTALGDPIEVSALTGVRIGGMDGRWRWAP